MGLVLVGTGLETSVGGLPDSLLHCSPNSSHHRALFGH